MAPDCGSWSHGWELLLFFCTDFRRKKTNLRKLLNEALVSAHQLKFGENVKQVLIAEGMRSAARPTAVYNVHTK